MERSKTMRKSTWIYTKTRNYKKILDKCKLYSMIFARIHLGFHPMFTLRIRRTGHNEVLGKSK